MVQNGCSLQLAVLCVVQYGSGSDLFLLFPPMETIGNIWSFADNVPAQIQHVKSESVNCDLSDTLIGLCYTVYGSVLGVWDYHGLF